MTIFNLFLQNLKDFPARKYFEILFLPNNRKYIVVCQIFGDSVTKIKKKKLMVSLASWKSKSIMLHHKIELFLTQKILYHLHGMITMEKGHSNITNFKV